ncbi:MAG: hypothetical protein JRN05_03165 [Nitrososphaerota archaeon]|nr:hypothetical protein [Nitrososphaerota archaeon]MDG6957892.1 hypothetical protein [Nitrososphaerota archaeon]MDG6959497.1 hypothetical protein [Nitrososphaerota archaeon]MDG6962267.1 hypothetical protein [Nitrososphaerota archaeon]MDG6968071.1 hypothetical protein [Nitrososphaerota archaeon]
MKALYWAAALASWTLGVLGLFGWYIQSAVLPMVPAASARGELLSSADLLLAVGAAGMALNVAFLARGAHEDRQGEGR